MRLFTPGCKTNTQIQAFLQELRCCVVVYQKNGVTTLAREVIAIMLFTSGRKPTLIYKRSCMNGVAVVLLTLDTVFLHERQRDPQAGEGRGAWPGPSGEQAGTRKGCGAPRGLGGPRSRKHCWGSVGVETGPNMFCTRNPSCWVGYFFGPG